MYVFVRTNNPRPTFHLDMTDAEKQVIRVSRRLFVQTLLDAMILCWAAALIVAVAWFLAQPWLVGHNGEALRWTVAGIIFGVGMAIGAVNFMAWLFP